MKRVRYARPRANFVRRLRPIDLRQLGIDHNEELVWNQANRFEIVLSNKVSESLVARLPDEFILFEAGGEDEAPEVKEPMTSIAESASVDSEGVPDESVVDEMSLDAESSVKASRRR